MRIEDIVKIEFIEEGVEWLSQIKDLTSKKKRLIENVYKFYKQNISSFPIDSIIEVKIDNPNILACRFCSESKGNNEFRGRTFKDVEKYIILLNINFLYVIFEDINVLKTRCSQDDICKYTNIFNHLLYHEMQHVLTTYNYPFISKLKNKAEEEADVLTRISCWIVDESLTELSTYKRYQSDYSYAKYFSASRDLMKCKDETKAFDLTSDVLQCHTYFSTYKDR